MKSIRIANLRSIKDTGKIDLKTITLLVGKNGSGKSTFLRLFPLLRQSVEARTHAPILWYGQYVDYGGFQKAIKRNSESHEIIFEFICTIPKGPGVFPWFFSECITVMVAIKFVSDSKNGKTYVGGINLDFNEDNIVIEIDKSDKLSRFDVNNLDIIKSAHEEFLISLPAKIIPSFQSKKLADKWPEGLMYKPDPSKLDPVITSVLLDTIKPFFHDKSKCKGIFMSGIERKELFLNRMQKMKSDPVWKRKVAEFTTSDPDFNKIRNLFLASLVPGLLVSLDNYLSEMVRHVSYIAPVRASTERYYREQELAIDEVDHRGLNLATFLRGMTDTEQNIFRVWTRKNMGLEVYSRHTGSHIALTLVESGSEHEYNLADMGFGFSQILPAIVQLWAMTERPHKEPETLSEEIAEPVPKIFSVEQPELHLHPGYQAKVADMLIAAVAAAKKSNTDIRLIVETHSEVIINRIGNQIAAGKIDHDDVNVVIFEKQGPDDDTEVS
ncbi:MAG: AAA family ATPase [Desulfobacterales bacterium]|nr:AAA family ATPase [Desulfobacterales bacterium]